MQKRLVPCSTTTAKGGVCGEKRPGLVLVVVARWHELPGSRRASGFFVRRRHQAGRTYGQEGPGQLHALSWVLSTARSLSGKPT